MLERSRFFAYLGRLRWIKRWGLKRNTQEENVMEHSWQVATIAHALAVLHQLRGGDINPYKVATTALYHDASEIITGDMPTPIKYRSERIRTAYQEIELEAEKELLALLPQPLQAHYEELLLSHQVDGKIARFVKAADVISAYLKCQAEMQAGNNEFKEAMFELEQRVRQLNMPEVDEFMASFNESYLLTLDELLQQHEQQQK